jgi:hypothetical protein
MIQGKLFNESPSPRARPSAVPVRRHAITDAGLQLFQ